MALAAYATENSSVQQLSSHQLDVMKRVIEILSPVEEITRSISADLAAISIVIPYIHILTRALEKITDGSGILTMKRELLYSLKLRFNRIEENKKLSLATFLDPRFKDLLKQQLKKFYWKKCPSLTLVCKVTLKWRDQQGLREFAH